MIFLPPRNLLLLYASCKFLLLLAFICNSNSAGAQWKSQQCVILDIPYNETSDLTKYLYDSVLYEEARSQENFEYITFRYPSDEYEVEGFLCKPIDTDSKSDWPVILYNRGGTGNYGKLTPQIFPYFYQWAKAGFLVIASNYRFIDEYGRMDQLGGEELQDILNLYKVLSKLDYVDQNNIFMIGVSRGGLMTYQALTKLQINASAVIGGVTNSFLHFQTRPIFIEGWDDLSEPDNYEGLKNILPDFTTRRETYLTNRSPVKWARDINSPIYILHSRQDGFVNVEQAIEMACELQKYQKSYQLKIYDQKSHSLPGQYFDSFQEILIWFISHQK